MSELLPGAEEVAFVDLPPAAEAAIATVVIVSPRERIGDAADALRQSAATGGVRLILIVAGGGAPAVRAGAEGILLDGLKPEHFNNAVAALRFSSLPTVVWWRGGSPGVLPGLAALADRLVLDAADPREVWTLVPGLAERTAVTDLRWARLTRWRALMAHFFDMPAVEAGRFKSLVVRGADEHAARLFAGWLTSSLRPNAIDVEIERTRSARVRAEVDSAAIEYVRLAQEGLSLTLRLAASGTCVMSAVERAGADECSQTVSLGNQNLAALIAEELRIRSRDAGFERAVGALGGERA